MKATITVVFIFMSFFGAANIVTGSNNIEIQPTRLFEGVTFSSLDKIIKYKDKFYVLETKNHRLLVLDQSIKQIGQISKVGQGKGEIYYPSDFTIKNELIYIVDGNDRGITRIQTFDLRGKYVNEFTAAKSYGFEVNSRGEIYLGQPEKGKLISVYTRQGKLIRSFGKLSTISYFYGPSVEDMDKEFKVAINRVNLCIDGEDNLYLSFVGAPFFRKYSNKEKLIFEKKINGPETEEIITGFRKRLKSPIRRTIDNVPTPFITSGIAVDNHTGNIIIIFQWKHAWFYLANSKGEKISVFEPIDKTMLFHNITLSGDATLFLPRLSIVKYNEGYIFKIGEGK